MFITDLLYDIDIVNNLFSFDLTKKKVLIKYKKKEEINNLELEGINVFQSIILSKKNKIQKENNQNDKIKDKNIYCNIQENTSKKKRKKKERKFCSSNISDIQQNKEDKETIDNNEIKAYNITPKIINIIKPNNVSVLSNDRMISDSIDKKNNNNINIKENVDINNFFVIFAFCCIRKRKNVNSYILGEGLNIIKERLDILKIFKILYYDEKFHESLKNENIEIEMSDNCKKKLQ